MDRLDTRLLSIARDERLAVVCVRNERLRLPYFLTYYRRLGIQRFLVIDNASDDGTTEALLVEPDVHVFQTRDHYSTSRYGVDWINALLARYAVGRWTLTVDADELFVYPGCEVCGLDRLTHALERRHEDAILTFLLDMYGERAVRETTCAPGQPWLDVCAWFDRDGYEWNRDHPRYGAVPQRGGPRRRRLWPAGTSRPAPFLPKIPLVRWQAGLAYTASTHILDGPRLSALTGVLLHFKLLADFVDKAPFEARRAEHWDQGAQYAAYAAALEADPALTCRFEGSVRYEDSRQLVSLGLAQAPSDFW